MNKRIIYLCHENRHPYHDAYAQSIGARRIVGGLSDKSSRLKNYYHSLKIILTFPYSRCDAILTDGPDVISLIIKRLSFNKIKLISTQANNHLYDYFFYKKYLTLKYRKHFKRIINKYDLIICLGEIQYNLANKICEGNKNVTIVESYNGVSSDRNKKLSLIKYNPNSKKIVSLSNQGTEYLNDMKGLDIMLSVFSKLSQRFPELEYYHIGPYRDKLLSDYKFKFPNYNWKKIHFVGKKINLENWFNDAICMFHLSRKDSFPVAVTEAYSAGVPVFIGHRVGLRRMYSKINDSERFIINVFDEVEAIDKINDFLSLSLDHKIQLSNSFKLASKDYTSEKALANYKSLVQEFFKQ